MGIEENLCRREDLFITTKITPNTWRLQEVVDIVNQSLEILQLEYIDLVMIHFPGLPKGFTAEQKPERFANIPRDPKEIAEARMQMWEALQTCQKEGKINHHRRWGRQVAYLDRWLRYCLTCFVCRHLR